MAKVEWRPGELYPRVESIVTNMTRPVERVVVLDNQRGTAEQYIKQGKNAVTWTRLSCTRYATNAMRSEAADCKGRRTVGGPITLFAHVDELHVVLPCGSFHTQGLDRPRIWGISV